MFPPDIPIDASSPDMERWRGWFQAVANRDTDLATFRMLLATDSTFDNAWQRAEKGRLAAAGVMLKGLSRVRLGVTPAHIWHSLRWAKPKMGRGPAASVWGAPVLPPGASHTWTPELAITMGEISRLAQACRALETKDEQQAPLIDSSAPDEWIGSPLAKTLFGEAPDVQQVFPTMALIGDGMWQHRKDSEEPGLDVPFVIDRVEDLETLRAHFSGTRNSVPGLSAWGRGFFPDLSATLGRPGLLASEQVPGIFEAAYERRWHTKPATKSAYGAIVDKIRERTRLTGDPRLLVVLAASSDGANRAAAGGSARTPEPVYDKLIYDNALEVLKAVVQHPSFDNDKAYSMIDTGLAPQITAVMRYSKSTIDIAIRVIACERAIAHPDVDPYQTHMFLLEHRTNPGVPRTLWPQMMRTLMGRIAQAEEENNLDLAKDLRSRLAAVGTSFLDEVLVPYGEAHKTSLRTGNAANWMRPSRTSHRTFFKETLESSPWLMDPDLMDIVAQGFVRKMKPDSLLVFLKACNDAQIPVPDSLAIACSSSEDGNIRKTFMLALPEMSEDDPAPRRERVVARLAAARQYIQDMVFENVIPDHVGIEGTKRELSRMHHHFLIANMLDKDTLVAKFVQVAEEDPRAIPDAFAALTLDAMASERVEKATSTVASLDEPSIPRMIDRQHHPITSHSANTKQS